MSQATSWGHRAATVTGLQWLRQARRSVLRWVEAHEVDGVHFLTVYVAVLLVLPGVLVLAPLGAVGRPSGLLAVFGAACWFLNRVIAADRPRGGHLSPGPVRVAGAMCLVAVTLSYIAAMARPITSTELNSLHAGMVAVAGWAGLLLIAGDGIPSTERLFVLVRRLTVGVGFCALVGILQFVTGQTLTDRIQIPGLSVNTIVATVTPRDGFSRAIGTTISPIEFGVLMAAMLPLCVHVGMFGSGSALRRWWPTAAVAVAIPFANSRSGVVALVVCLVVAFPTWPPAVRLRALVVGAVGAMAVFVLVPGMLGTITGMFQGVSDDPSTTSRTGSYELGGSFIERSPFVGRGFMTFLPPYRVIDNQYLGLLIDTGLLGTASFVGLLVTGIVIALRCRGRSTDPRIVSLAGAMTATISVAAVSFAFFDALSFPTIAGLTVLVLGLVEALWLILRRAPDLTGTSGSPTHGSVPGPRVSR